MSTTRFGCVGSAHRWEMGCNLDSKKLSISYVTGQDELDPDVVTGAQAFTRYARAMLGCKVPVGTTDRGLWYTQLSSEMEAQGWSWADMVKTVQYVNRKGIRIRKVFGVFYFVQEALKEGEQQEITDLQLKVADAVTSETDEMWVRRLSLAKGKALELVYREWERKNEV